MDNKKESMAEEIERMAKERGRLTFSMLMVKFHISSVEAENLISEYVSKDLISKEGYLKKGADGMARPWSIPLKKDHEKEVPAETPIEDSVQNKSKENVKKSKVDVPAAVPKKKAKGHDKAKSKDTKNVYKQEKNGQLSLF